MAKALYDLTDQISDWELLEEIFSSQELIDVLSSPTISLDKKWNICDNLAEKTGMNKLCNNFVKMMCKIGEIDEISDILLAYRNRWDREHHVVRPEVIVDKDPSAERMDEIQKLLREQYPDSEIQMNLRVDPEIMGGYVIRVDHHELDRSYEGYLKQLENKLSRR
ncbi:MAG: ATP synthase F1 subunit delta [Lachnospiraceae bacterium]|nr:ATP synthase F1 subunit delta [Lachnospiraceae bacterium]